MTGSRSEGGSTTTSRQRAVDAPFRIGMLAPIAWRVPPRHYGPWERVVSILTEGLVARGVDVTLFATADSETHARLQAVAPRGYEEDPSLDAKVYEALHIGAAFEAARRGEIDLLHNHFDFLPLTYSRLVQPDVPVVTTIHGLSSERIVPVYRAYNDVVRYVAISAADRHPALSYAATIHHGVPLEEFTFCEQPVAPPDDYLLYFGRIHPDKGAHDALALARRTNRRLVLAGIVHDEQYWRRDIEPYVDGDRVRYVGSVGPEERDRLLGGATALLHLIHFPEPFGLSVVEALATGTPVIAAALGSLPELVRDGVNGFLVPEGNLDAAEAALRHVAELNRRACREDVAARFSAGRMVDDYLRPYRQVLET
ncbi:MAG TPA: glycosyltransferase family 4 protein [Gemmatimonadales bacterium]|nr:glycosyltransferase family 4 protein [Gemmatimonadales bacterium]